ncbi:hypothetical protein S83_000267 [Arachis hypogaea]
MSITLQDVAYQLGLRISGDPVSGCMAGWELFYEGRSIVDICQQLLGAVPGPADRQKWNINLSWFRETVCGNLEEDATPERLLQYTRGYIMQLIGGFLFPDQSNTRVHLRWLPLLEDLDQCGQLSWGSAVLAFLYRMLCRGTCYTQHNMGGCMSLLLSWAYHRIPSCRPKGFDQRRFPLVERWVGYEQRNDSEEFRLRWWRRLLNNLDIHNKYIQWYLGWAHLVLVGHGDQQDPIAGRIPPDLSDYTPHAPEIRQPKDGDLPELHPGGGRQLRREPRDDDIGVLRFTSAIPEDYLTLEPLCPTLSLQAVVDGLANPITGSSIGICESRIWYSTGTYDGSVLDYGRIVVFRCSRTIASTGRACRVVTSGGSPAYYVQECALMHASPPPSIYASRHVNDPRPEIPPHLWVLRIS